MKKLPRAFYSRSALHVAKDLLGKILVRKIGRTTLLGRIVEVEAYLGAKDPASHTYRGKTKRNEVMFWGGGHLYVYFTYGMHFCCNVVTEGKGVGHAVLIRAVEPMAGIEVMKRNRERLRKNQGSTILCSGPARLCQAFGIGRAQNGADLCGKEIWIAIDPNSMERPRISKSTRIGITNGKQHNWRFFLTRNTFVSRGRPV